MTDFIPFPPNEKSRKYVRLLPQTVADGSEVRVDVTATAPNATPDTDTDRDVVGES